MLLILVLVVLGIVLRLTAHPGRDLSGTAQAPDHRSVVSAWLKNAVPAAWSGSDGRIFINRMGADGLWNGYSIRPSGRDLRCITCRVPSFRGVGAATNRATSDVSPNGRYVLLVVEQGSHPGRVGSEFTQPGKGVFNDIWLATADGSRAWRLTDIPTSTASGIIFARFDRTGQQVVWSQMYHAGNLTHPLGEWAIKLARLTWSAGVPKLVDVRTYDPEPGRFFEPYQFSPDDRRLLFASDIGVPSDILSPSAFNSRIWTINAAHLDDLVRVSPPEPLHGMFSDYNEFAFYIPGTNRILIGRTYGAAAHGLDYWTVADDGSDPLRVTFLNQPGNPQYLGYSQVGGVAFDPSDPRRFIASVQHRLLGNDEQAVFVTLEAGLP
jgi:hypothetical protein